MKLIYKFILFSQVKRICTHLFACKWAAIISLQISIYAPLCLNAQTEKNVNYSTEDGLPSSQVYDIIQDDYGFIWFSTDKGLSRYNGYEFENFNRDDGLVDNVVYDFFKQDNGKIWCTTNSGSIFWFAGANPEFHDYRFNDSISKYVKDLTPNGMFISDDNELFVSYSSAIGYLKIDASGQIKSNPIGLEASGRLTEELNVKSLQFDPFFFYDDDTYVSSLGHYSFSVFDKLSYEQRDNDFEALHFETKNVGVIVSAISIEIDNVKEKLKIKNNKEPISSGKLNENEFWIGFRGGGFSIYNLQGIKTEDFLFDKSVTQIFDDSQGDRWVSTLASGIFRIDDSRIKSLKNSNEKVVRHLSVDENDELVVGYFNGAFSNITGPNNDTGFDLYSYCSAHVMHQSNSWINHYFLSHSFSKNRKSLRRDAGKTEEPIRYVLRGKDLIDVKTRKILNRFFLKNRIKDITHFNNTVYGGSTNGLYSASLWNKREDENLSFEGLRIDELAVFRDYLVLGTNGDGIKLLNKEEEVVLEISDDEGLSSNYVSGLYVENDDVLWVCTNRGINRIQFPASLKSFVIDKLDVKDGLSSNETWDVCVLRDTVWVGTQGGLDYFPNEDLGSILVSKRDYYMQWRTINVNDMPIKRVSSFTYDQNKFEFNFIAMSYSMGNELEYRYQLKGIEKNWSYTKNRKIVFSSLPSGEYELVVQAKGKNRFWKENQIKYTFIIHPAFWKTWWFFIVCAFLLIVLIYTFFKIRVLTYNKDVVREILRYLLQVIRRDAPSIMIKQDGNDIKLKTSNIHFIKTSGNYLEIHTPKKTYLVRSSFSKFTDSLPDKLEFIQVHRSYMIRQEHVQEKGKNELLVLDNKIPVGRVYHEQIRQINL